MNTIRPILALLLVVFLLLGLGQIVKADTWVSVGSVRGLASTNYQAFGQGPDGKAWFFGNDPYSIGGGVWDGKVVLQKSSLPGRASKAKNIIPRSELAKYKDENGTPMTYSRTNAFAYDGKCHALMHVGAPYGHPSGYNFRPAYAKSNDCKTWKYYGPVSVDGVQAPKTFSSSMAYVVRNGVHWMIQGAKLGESGVIVYRSTNGRDYQRYGGDFKRHSGDRPVWPDLAYCGGKWHAVYNSKWPNSNIRHLQSYDLLNWALLDDRIPPSNYKGMNIGCYNGTLYGVASGKVWKYGDFKKPKSTRKWRWWR